MMETSKTNTGVFLKKGALLVCTFVFLFVFLFFAACKPENKLDMDYYTLANSSYTLASASTQSVTTPSTDFVRDTKIYRQYLTITINLSSEWLYLLKAQKFTFCLETNKDASLQFDITITNLKQGELNGTLGVKSTTYTLVCDQKAGTSKTYAMEIDDIFEQSAANTTVIFTLTNYELFTTNQQLNDFAYSLSEFCIYGVHAYSNFA